MQLGRVPYAEAWELQRALAAAVSQGAIPDTVVLLEHPPVITLGRRTDEAELHVPEGPTSRSSRPTGAASRPTTGPGQLVCYPILDLHRHGQDVKQVLPRSRGGDHRDAGRLRPRGGRIEGLTGVWFEPTLRGRSPRSAFTSRGGSRRTATRSTSTSTRRRSRSGSPPAGSRTPRSRRSLASSGGRSPSTTCGPRGGRARRRVRPRPRGAPAEARPASGRSPCTAHLGEAHPGTAVRRGDRHRTGRDPSPSGRAGPSG